MNYICDYDSPLGKILLACSESGLSGLWFYGQKYFASGLDIQNASQSGHEILDSAKRWLDIYFTGNAPDFTPDLDINGTNFQLKVWQVIQNIPRGMTITYQNIAEKINCRSAQPVSAAVGHNKISIIIPCHRVIGSDGSLTGYAGGLERKIKLLSLEGVKIEVREKHFVS